MRVTEVQTDSDASFDDERFSEGPKKAFCSPVTRIVMVNSKSPEATGENAKNPRKKSTKRRSPAHWEHLHNRREKRKHRRRTRNPSTTSTDFSETHEECSSFLASSASYDPLFEEPTRENPVSELHPVLDDIFRVGSKTSSQDNYIFFLDPNQMYKFSSPIVSPFIYAPRSHVEDPREAIVPWIPPFFTLFYGLF